MGYYSRNFRSRIWGMKNIQGYLIIGISIIVAAIIIVLFFPDSNASVNHCYKKIYQYQLGSSKDESDMSDAAVWAKEMCLDK